jgi:serine/threonine protein phosphatase PrpC
MAHKFGKGARKDGQESGPDTDAFAAIPLIDGGGKAETPKVSASSGSDSTASWNVPKKSTWSLRDMDARNQRSQDMDYQMLLKGRYLINDNNGLISMDLGVLVMAGRRLIRANRELAKGVPLRKCEDYLLVREDVRLKGGETYDLIAVFDALGSKTSRSETLSAAAATSINDFMKLKSGMYGEPAALILDAMVAANGAVAKEIKDRASEGLFNVGGRVAEAPPGTTAIVALVGNGKAHVFSIGDSRYYLMRADGIYASNKDDSMVVDGRYLRDGLPPDELKKNMAFKHMPPGSILLLCTDGVSKGLEGMSDKGGRFLSTRYAKYKGGRVQSLVEEIAVPSWVSHSDDATAVAWRAR